MARSISLGNNCLSSISTVAATSLPESASQTAKRAGGWTLGVLSAAYLAVMALVALPAYLDASTAWVDPVSLAWLLAAGLVVPIGLGSLARQVTAHRPSPIASVAAPTPHVGVAQVQPEQASAGDLDTQTGLRTYAGFAEELARQVDLATEGGHPVSLAIVDIDQLAKVNSELGQEAGDRLLSGIGRLIAMRTRADDVAFRIGGDELAILMPHCGAGRAQSVLRRLLLAALEEGEASRDGREWSFSAGVSSFPELSETADTIRRDAEAALKWAKRNGRTDIQLFDALRDLSEEQRREDEVMQNAASSDDDYFTTGEQDAPPIQLRFLSAEPAQAPQEWVDPRLVLIGLANDPDEAQQAAPKSPKARSRKGSNGPKPKSATA